MIVPAMRMRVGGLKGQCISAQGDQLSDFGLQKDCPAGKRLIVICLSLGMKDSSASDA